MPAAGWRSGTVAGGGGPGCRRPLAGRCSGLRILRVMTDTSALDPEDRKIVTLARSARARNSVPEGAAVRDETGRTYVAGTVALDSLRLTALQTAVAMAVASGATSLEAAAVVTDAAAPSEADRAAVADLGGAATPILLAGPDGTIRSTTTAG
ncbi:cytidine deaminase [Streptomyces sulfonofaciens]|uniref:Cytidine deaminase n=2 Tax=Streptomyces sulfonofaciens TaxID=68272 RepID=A0A919L8J3_9ACTN|nr:cytidine deaminase [Streptomyces sulfonofaciens]